MFFKKRPKEMIDAFTLKKKNDENNNSRISFIDTSSFINNNDSDLQNININSNENNPDVSFCDRFEIIIYDLIN